MENIGHSAFAGSSKTAAAFWTIACIAVPLGYCFFYAPYGINETDGGFLTGLAWQVLSGKALYSDVVYVRPPLPVWLRALEMQLLPDNLAMLGERWIFYIKVALYSWFGAAVLCVGVQRRMLAVFGFVVSVHCYPPAAWHTVDGILFSVLGIFCLTGGAERGLRAPGLLRILGGALFIFAALLCKQSFYPMVAVFAGLVFPLNPAGRPDFARAARGVGALLACGLLFAAYLYNAGLLENYLRLTGSAASGGQAFQHGVLDYFRIKPVLAVPAALLIAFALWSVSKRKNYRMASLAWLGCLMLLAGSYVVDIYTRQEFTIPFAQSRFLFWVALAFCLLPLVPRPLPFAPCPSPFALCSLLSISWCASISWGYNLPILFATPWVYVVLEISRGLWQRAWPEKRLAGASFVALALMLAVFRYGYEFVYRDGKRSVMYTDLGKVFPALQGVYSTPEKSLLYIDLKNLAARHPVFKTLPAFPQANFLTGTKPPLPLDWVVRRETNGDDAPLWATIRKNRPVLLVEKGADAKIAADPELAFVRDLLQKATILEETTWFRVMLPE